MGVFELDTITKLTKEDTPIYKIPNSVQKTIDISAIAENGIFCHTKKKNKDGNLIYSKAYRFEDVPYATLDIAEKEEKILSWCSFLNSMGVSFKWILQNKNKDMDKFRKKTMYELRGDEFDIWRTAYNELQDDRIAQGKQGIELDMLFVVRVLKTDYKSAFEFYGTLENKLKDFFHRFGSCLVSMDAVERLKSLHDFYRMGREDEFHLTWEEIKKGKNYINSICNTKLSFHEDYIEDEQKFSRILFIKDFPKALRDNFVRDMMDLQQHLTFTVDVIPIPKSASGKFVANKLMGVEGDISKQQEQRNKRGQFTTDITWDKRQERDEVENVLNSIQNLDQEMFYISVTIIVTANTKEELEANMAAFINKADEFSVVVDTLYYQQREGLNTALPLGVRQIKTLRAMITNGVGALVPFSTQEICEDGNFYGVNQVSRNVMKGNRKKLQNPHGFVFGTSGSGKSFFVKGENVQNFIGTEDDIIFLDPKNEYHDVCDLMHGEFLNITSGGGIYINPYEINIQELKHDPEAVISDKVDLSYGICQQATLGQLSGVDCSLIDRGVRLMYGPLISGASTKQVTMQDFSKALESMPEEEAAALNLSIERFVKGSLDVFSHASNVNINNRVVGFGLSNLGKSLRGVGLLITLEHIKARIKKNYEKGKATWICIDEIHNLLQDPFSADYLYKFWKEYRQFMGICTGITQNVDSVLRSPEGKEMLANSEFVYLTKQAPTDRDSLLQTVDITNAQLSYVTNSDYGKGLLKFGKNIIPIDNYLDKKKGTDAEKKLYQLYNTNSFENAI